MSIATRIASGLLLGAALCGGASAAQDARTAQPADCRQVGANTSALIDASGSSPNIAGARAAFQRGIMKCMEGDDTAANDIYRQAAALLGQDSPAVPDAALPQTAVDCRKTGSNVSALIDTSAQSPNLAGARAAFQRGIMLCMEGDDVAAVEEYQTARKLLADN